MTQQNNTMEERFEKYFYRTIDVYLLKSLEQWQIGELKRMMFKIYKKQTLAEQSLVERAIKEVEDTKNELENGDYQGEYPSLMLDHIINKIKNL